MSDAPFYVKWLDGFFPPGAKMGPMMDKVLWRGIMQGTFEDREAAQKRFVEWNEEVRKVTDLLDCLSSSTVVTISVAMQSTS